MNEKPILFSSEMVRAILQGRKTQTRRVIKLRDGSTPEWDGYDIPKGEDNKPLDYVMDFSKNYPQWQRLDCPYGKARDRLWVRETWQGVSMQTAKWWHETPRNERPLHNWQWTNPVVPALQSIPPKWLPSIHMPRMVSRITLEVVNVRVERLQDISVEDALAEGCPPENHDEPTSWYKSLWDSINTDRGYDFHSDPWVWVVEFKVV